MAAAVGARSRLKRKLDFSSEKLLTYSHNGKGKARRGKVDDEITDPGVSGWQRHLQ